MPTRVVGVGLYRTGTMSLKSALERLLGRPLYHIAEVFIHPEHISISHPSLIHLLPCPPIYPLRLRLFPVT